MDMLDKYYVTILHVIAYLTRCLPVPSQPSIRLALITDSHSSSNWTGVFQRALQLDNNLTYLRQEVTFEFYAVSERNLQSFGDMMDMLCEELLPRQVHAVFLSTESYEFTKFMGLIPVLILGTKRDIAFENQVVFQNYKYLRSVLTHQSEVIQGILDSLQVAKYSILYDGHEGNDKLVKEIISAYKTRAGNVFKAVLPSENLNDSASKFLVAEELVRIKIHQIRVIVLACRELSVKNVFEVAKELGMVSGNFLWIGTESVVRAINDSAEKTSVSNFIGIRLNTSDETIALKALQILSSSVQANSSESTVTVPSINESCFGDNSQWITDTKFPSYLEQAIPSSSFDEKLLSDTYAIIKLENNNSSMERSWRQIGVHQDKISTIQMEGNIIPDQFSRIPRKTEKVLRIVSIEHGQYLYKVGGVMGCEGKKLCTQLESLQRRSLELSCELGVPCFHHVNSQILNETEEEYVFCVSGLMIDLLGLIQNKLDFSYELYLVPDGKYGAIDDTTGLWNGMIGEVLYGHADIALGTITINAQRSQVVDFTSPYGEVGIGMMISNGNTARPLITMEFLEPFGTSLWIAIVTTIFTVLVALWLLDRKISEVYFKSRRTFLREKKKEEPKTESVTFLESMSYTWSTFVHVPAGSGFPRSFSARFVAIFFAFAMIILSGTYTANLVANKVKDEAEPPITGIRDDKMLNPPPGFHFGTLRSSSTEAYFKFNRDPRMRKIYENMKNYNVENVHDGVKKVKSGEISVYIDDQPYLEHMVSSQHDCSLRIVGKPFGISGYGLVLRKNSPWIQPISSSIQQFSDDNVLADLWSKWLVRKCLKKEDFEKTPDRLSIYNYNGVFVLVAAGILISILFLGFERKIAFSQEKKKGVATEQEIEKEDDVNDPSTAAMSDNETDNNVKNNINVNFACSNPVLQVEECDHDAQHSNGLKFTSIC